jgi:hypothetical protein
VATKWGREGREGCRLVGCGLSPTKWFVTDCRLWVVADEMGKGGACGFSSCQLWVVVDEMGCRRLSVVGCCRRNGEGARGFSFDGLSSKEERALKRGETRRWA